ncbi:hypothetical protein R6Q59_002525 [Mikania micrantha]
MLFPSLFVSRVLNGMYLNENGEYEPVPKCWKSSPQMSTQIPPNGLNRYIQEFNLGSNPGGFCLGIATLLGWKEAEWKDLGEISSDLGKFCVTDGSRLVAMLTLWWVNLWSTGLWLISYQDVLGKDKMQDCGDNRCPAHPGAGIFFDSRGRLCQEPKLNRFFNETMANDSRLVTIVILEHCKDVFEGLDSIVDVGGGTGTVAKAIAESFPDIRCIHFDLPRVVHGLVGSKNLSYVGGDMFEIIPHAHAVLLKVFNLFEQKVMIINCFCLKLLRENYQYL